MNRNVRIGLGYEDQWEAVVGVDFKNKWRIALALRQNQLNFGLKIRNFNIGLANLNIKLDLQVFIDIIIE